MKRIRLTPALVAAGLLALAVTAPARAAVPGRAGTVHGTGYKVPGASYLLAVACPPAGECIAVGHPSLASHLKNGIFVGIANGKPGAVHQVVGTNAGLDHVACPRASFCIALGQAFTSGHPGSPEEVYTDISHGVAGTLHTVHGINEVGSIGCGGHDSCWAAGAECSSSGACTPEVAHFLDGTVKGVYRQKGSYSFSTGGAETEDGERGPTPACSSAGSCILAGASDAGHLDKSTGLLFSLVNGRVTIIDRVPAVSVITGLNCTSTEYCTIIGYNVHSSHDDGDVLTLSGGRLSAATPLPASVGPLACQSASSCFAFGYQVTGSSGKRVIIPVDHGKPAAPQQLPQQNRKPVVISAACIPTRCEGSGNLGLYPSPVAGWILSFQ